MNSQYPEDPYNPRPAEEFVTRASLRASRNQRNKRPKRATRRSYDEEPRRDTYYDEPPRRSRRSEPEPTEPIRFVQRSSRTQRHEEEKPWTSAHYTDDSTQELDPLEELLRRTRQYENPDRRKRGIDTGELIRSTEELTRSRRRPETDNEPSRRSRRGYEAPDPGMRAGFDDEEPMRPRRGFDPETPRSSREQEQPSRRSRRGYDAPEPSDRRGFDDEESPASRGFSRRERKRQREREEVEPEAEPRTPSRRRGFDDEESPASRGFSRRERKRQREREEVEPEAEPRTPSRRIEQGMRGEQGRRVQQNLRPDQGRRIRRNDKPPQRRGKRLLTIVAVLLLVATVTLGTTVYRAFSTPDYDGEGTGSVNIVVAPGQSGSQIGNTLEKEGVVKSARAFIKALENNPGKEIQPGTYALAKEMSADSALEKMRSTGRAVHRVTIREGLWKAQVFEELAKVTNHKPADYAAVEKQNESDPSILKLPASAKGNVEGYLFPATYEFDPGTTPAQQLRQMVNHTLEQLKNLGVQEADAERMITLASIVEAEARLNEDRPKVARVILNRLAKPMRLQLDSTVSYGVQNRSITTTDAERANKNPYNTYVNDGLPAGPIGNPGAQSIKAAIQPAEGPWLYFVAIDPVKGTTVFSNTKAEHDNAVRQFQQWCQQHPGTC
ncbi:endolytic transglycosylase MltG [Dermatophilus congolensis]|uniref:endolytic transglycosylase MltG n=1 Tax=Dermatophilus congolensis TaxID=1863 RepID=UPI001AAF764C|nr:endolytic transglycosylase MltG [Dermatophilus congolensis]MBO3142411.1 endolytic transglycosylase MltG [Dermatophilus congolensis]MBO3161596.1 endolytic transglycosylase MltG [Dermatophilus congolensis]MBO3162687.1 endolytic transglycosylase MltG [Dermatophilus congolensis]MBO3176240.1 endolytic transglycosylase MltG [Dermatophilus congolensis]MBO3183000.1 endolytic transglycosylase MltG [Dermatophilus congolensis]